MYLPYVKWSLIFLVLHNILVSFKIYGEKIGISFYDTIYFIKQASSIAIMRSTEVLTRPLWFFESLFVSLLIFYTILKITQNFKYTKIYLLVTSVSICYVGYILNEKNISLPFNLQREMTVQFLITLGYVFKNKCKNIGVTNNWAIIALCFVSLCFLGSFGTIDILYCNICNPLFLTICTFIGFIMMHGLSSKLTYTRKAFTYIGNNTIPILALHYTSFKLVSLIKIYCTGLPITMLSSHPVIKQDNEVWGWIYAIVGISLPLGFTYIKKKISLYRPSLLSKVR